MSSSDRRSFLGLIAAVPLAACGFTPAYAPGAAASTLRGRVLADAPTDRNGFGFVARIEDRLGHPEVAAYRLAYKITTQRVDLAVTTEGSILRYNILGQVAFSLTDAASGAVLKQGRTESFTGSAATRATIAAQSAEDDAYQRLMQILADQVATQLIATAPTWAVPG